jgi:hypothetical protein
MKTKKLYYIGRRDNPQFKKSYFIRYGQLSKAEAARKEKCVYGSMWLTGFDSHEEFLNEIDKLRNEGYNIH